MPTGTGGEMIQGINYVMLILLLAVVGAAIIIRRSPDSMTAIAAWLMSTAEADIERAKYHAKRLEAWRRHLGVE
jgi:hypothetical protein